VTLEKATTGDHIDLTFMYAKLLNRGFLDRSDVERLKYMAEKLKDRRLRDLLSGLRYAGAGRFVPKDREWFVTTLDAVRYDVHRVVERRIVKPGTEVRITDTELLMMFPEEDIRLLEANEGREDDVIKRELEGRWITDLESEIRVEVQDDLRRKRRRVKLNMYTKHDAVRDFWDEASELYCKIYPEDPHCYVLENAKCEYDEEEMAEECELHLGELFRRLRSEGERRSAVWDIRRLLEDAGCVVEAVRGERMEFTCESDWTTYASEELDEMAVTDEKVKGMLTEKLLREYREGMKRFMERSKIPLKCKIEYGYPHVHGFFFYSKCVGEKEYPLDVEGSARSIKEVHETFKEFIREFGYTLE